MANDYEFTVSICTEYTSKEIEIELIALYNYFPESKGTLDVFGQQNEPDVEAEIEIECVIAKHPYEMLAFLIAREINNQRDFDHLETEILIKMGES